MDLVDALALEVKDVAKRLGSLPVKSAALFVYMMTPSLAKAVLAEMPEDKRIPLALQLIDVPRYQHEDLSQAKSDLASVFGIESEASFGVASEVLSELLDTASPAARNQLVVMLSRQPGVYAAVREKVILIDDLLQVDRETLDDLLGDLSGEELAKLFAVISDALRNRIASIQPARTLVELQRAWAEIHASPTRFRKAEKEGEALERAIRRKLAKLVESGVIPHPGQSHGVGSEGALSGSQRHANEPEEKVG
jgi:flagellar motor switch protein FliG